MICVVKCVLCYNYGRYLILYELVVVMEYAAFLILLNQIESQKKAKVVVQGNVIFIETSCNNGHWSLSTKILRIQSKKLQRTLGSYLSRSRLKWQEKGAHILIDPDTQAVQLVQEIIPSKKYLPFKYVVQDFASVATEWKEIFEECSEEEDVILYLS